MPRHQQQMWHFVFTANNEDKEAVASKLRGSEDFPSTYFVLGNEQGTTPHVQGYVEFQRKPSPRNGYRISTLKKLDKHWHWELREGTQEQAIRYITGPGPIECSDGHIKNDFDAAPIIHGTPWESAQGHRSDIDAVVESVTSGDSITKIARSFPHAFLRMGSGIERLHARAAPKIKPLEEPPSVTLVVGSSGAGKTTFIRKQLIQGRDYYVPTEQLQEKAPVWFDEYRDEDIIWLQDYSGGLPRDSLMHHWDVDPVRVQRKGGSELIRPHHYFVCANAMPGNWYKARTPADKEKICRRITALYIPAGNFTFEKIPNPQQWCRDNFDKIF